MIDKQIDIDESLMLTFRRVLRFERLRNYIAPRDLFSGGDYRASKNWFPSSYTCTRCKEEQGTDVAKHLSMKSDRPYSETYYSPSLYHGQ